MLSRSMESNLSSQLFPTISIPINLCVVEYHQIDWMGERVGRLGFANL